MISLFCNPPCLVISHKTTKQSGTFVDKHQLMKPVSNHEHLFNGHWWDYQCHDIDSLCHDIDSLCHDADCQCHDIDSLCHDADCQCHDIDSLCHDAGCQCHDIDSLCHDADCQCHCTDWHKLPNRHNTLNQCWFNVVPASLTVYQSETNINLTSSVWWVLA